MLNDRPGPRNTHN
jgi:hypothetical protein